MCHRAQFERQETDKSVEEDTYASRCHHVIVYQLENRPVYSQIMRSRVRARDYRHEILSNSLREIVLSISRSACRHPHGAVHSLIVQSAIDISEFLPHFGLLSSAKREPNTEIWTFSSCIQALLSPQIEYVIVRSLQPAEASSVIKFEGN